MFGHYVPLIIFYQKILKTEQLENMNYYHSTSNLKSKKHCGQSSIKALYKGLPGKEGKLNLITSAFANKYAVVRVFGPSLIVALSSFFFWKI